MTKTFTLQDLDTMRQSTLNTAQICLKRLEYQFNPQVPIRNGIGRGLGTGLHGGLAAYYMKRREGGVVSNEEGRLARPSDELFQLMFDEAEQALIEDIEESEAPYDWRYQPSTARAPEVRLTYDQAVDILKQMLTWYIDEQHYWSSKFQIIAVEMPFVQPYEGMPGWTRSGTIDLVVYDPEHDQYILVDHKTSRKKWKKNKGMPTNPQAAWYVHAWQQHSGATNVTFVYDVLQFNLQYTKEGEYLGDLEPEFERRPAPRHQGHIDATLERGREVIQLIEQGGPFPANPESFLCSEAYCDFWHECPYGSTLNFVDMQEAA